MYNAVVLSDVHFGAFKASSLYKQLEAKFLRFIKTKKIDFIMITGDLFDKNINWNTEHSFYLNKFMDNLFTICKDKKIKLRILQGTLSHDLNQLENFRNQVYDFDFKVIMNAQIEYLYDDLHILYVPEEYIEDKVEYYKEFLDKKVDLCFGHGTFAFAGSYANKQESETNVKQAPIFNLNDFNNVESKVIFGHIHKHMKKDKVIYPGSFSRWSHGEEEDKGFLYFKYDNSNKSFKYKFIVNDLAPVYRTFDITKYVLSNDDIEEVILKKLSLLKRKYKNVRFTIDEKFISNARYEIIKEYFNDKADDEETSNIKFKVVNRNTIKENEDEELKELETKYSFIFQKNLSIEEIIKKFIEVTNNVVIKEDKIKELILDE